MNKEQAIRLTQECPGWCTEEKASRLYDLVIETYHKFPHTTLMTVELGVFGGRSLFAMAFAHKYMNEGFVFGIDTWDNVTPLEGTNAPENNEWWSTVPMDEIFNSCHDDRQIFELDECCSLIKQKSYMAADGFRDNSITLLHQDSNHNVETITLELERWSPKIRTGGFWVTDDNDWPETKEGYAKLPEFGFELIEDLGMWQIWRKV